MTGPADPRRRRALRGLAALPALGWPPLRAADAPAVRAGTGGGAATGGAAPLPAPTLAPDALSADWCGPDRAPPRPLFVPGNAGYLGRLTPRGAPLVLRAASVPYLPVELSVGPLAWRVRHQGRDYINPTLVLAPGERVRVELANGLDAPTILHWHGLVNDTRNDGAGFSLVKPGARKRYDFEVRNRGGLYWYHPHPHGSTAEQTYQGLFGALLVEDDDDAALRRELDLVPGITEIALLMQDRRTDDYLPADVDRLRGLAGDELYVNGCACPVHDVASRLYRFRILNACNARTLKLAFRTAGGKSVPCTLVGNDGGLLPAPRAVDAVFLAAAERIDLLVDLRDAPIGEAIVLYSLDFDPMYGTAAPVAAASTTATGTAGKARAGAATSGARQAPRTGSDAAGYGHGSAAARHAAQRRGGAAMNHHTWAEGALRSLLQLRVRERVAYDRRVPARLAPLPSIDVSDAQERPFRLGYNKGRWRINDKVFAMGETPIVVRRDTTEVWLLRNYHTSMPHAMHLHGFAFEVLERETSPDAVKALAVDDRGRLAADLGKKDTVLVWPGESVRVAVRFALPFPGPQTYVFHCHNLEHEDGGMMLGVRVT